jgi:hypothetical protein
MDDLERIGKELVSLVLVADPFGDYSKEVLCHTFKDWVAHFKEHFVADLRQPAKFFVSKHHRYYARKALQKVSVERCEEPARMLDEWSMLYNSVVLWKEGREQVRRCGQTRKKRGAART